MALTDFQNQQGGEKAFQFQDGSGFNASGSFVTRYTSPAQTSTAPTPAPTETPVSGSPKLAEVDEQGIRERVRKGMQDSIDAINANYANLIKREETLGQDRSGQTRAINARAGLMGSDFGQAQEVKTQQFNQQQVKSLQDEQAAKVAAIQMNIEDRASREIESQRNYNLQKFTADQSAFQKDQENARKDVEALAKAGVNFDGTNKYHQALIKQAGYDSATGELLWNAASKNRVDYKYEPKLGAFIGVDPVTHELKKIEVEGAGPEADTMLELIKKYPDAGITLSDTLETAAPKIKKSGIYRKETYIAPPSGTAGTVTGTSDPTVMAWVNQIRSGQAKITNVPGNLKNAVITALDSTTGGNSQLAQNALTVVRGMKSMSGLSGAVGAKGLSSWFGMKGTPIAGTAAADFVTKFDQLKSLLSLDNIKYLKGTGAISDAEQQMLANASTSLSRSQSEGEFRRTLDEIENTLNTAATNLSSNVVTTTDGKQIDLNQFEK